MATSVSSVLKSRLKYLNNYWMDRQLVYRHSCSVWSLWWSWSDFLNATWVLYFWSLVKCLNNCQSIQFGVDMHGFQRMYHNNCVDPQIFIYGHQWKIQNRLLYSLFPTDETLKALLGIMLPLVPRLTFTGQSTILLLLLNGLPNSMVQTFIVRLIPSFSNIFLSLTRHLVFFTQSH